MPTISVLIDAKVAGLGEVGALDAEVNKLGASTTNLGGSLDKTTGQLNVSGAAHAAVAKEAQALGADMEKASSQIGLAETAHLKAASATQNLSSQMGVAAGQAQAYGAQAETLEQKLGALQTASAATGAAGAEVSIVMQDLAAVDAKAASATSATTDAMAASSTAIAELAAVDGTLVAGKKKSAEEIAKEEAALERAKVAHEAHTEAVLKGVKATGEFGEAGVAAGEKLGALSGILGGAGGVNPAVAGLVVGLGAAVALGKAGTESFLSFGEEVLKFQHITGMTAESSSKLLDVFGQLGIGADVADTAMFQLAHRTEDLGGKIPKTQKTLQDLGVEVVKSKDGSTDLGKTLESVATAYASAGSAADKDAIAYAAFGKASQQLIPLLEQGGVGLRRMSDNATRVFDEAQLEQVKQYNIELARSGQEWDKLKDSIGQTVVEITGPAMKSINELNEGMRASDAAGTGSTRALNARGYASLQAAGAGEKLADQARKDAEAAKEEAASVKALNDQLQAQETDRLALLDFDNRSLQANFNLERSTQAVMNAQKTLADETLKDSEYANRHQAALDKVTVAQNNYTAAVKAHGPVSLQAKTAQDALNTALDASKALDQQNTDAADRLSAAHLQLKDSMLADAQGAVRLAEEQAKLSGSTLNAQDAAAAEAAELDKLKAAAGGVLPAELQTLLDQMNAFKDHTATLHLRLDDQTGGMKGSFGTQIPAFDEGGKVPGPLGMPRLAVVHGGEEVLTPQQQQTARVAMPAGPSMDDTNELLAEQNALLSEIRTALRSQPFSTRAYGS